MTALTPRQFQAALTELTPDPDTTPDLQWVWALGECDVCGAHTEVRQGDEGLTCRDCNDEYREPYDFADEPDYLRDDWSQDR